MALNNYISSSHTFKFTEKGNRSKVVKETTLRISFFFFFVRNDAFKQMFLLYYCQNIEHLIY